MSLLFAAALAASTATLPACSWDRPGVNPYTGDVAAAVDRYGDIPAAVRARLKRRMADRRYDDLAVIRRDSIEGRERYGPEIRDMHFGSGTVCRSVTRTKWAPAAEERGLVYCEAGHCLLVPTVCRNVSRITRLPAARAGGTAAEPGSVAASGSTPAETLAPGPGFVPSPDADLPALPSLALMVAEAAVDDAGSAGGADPAPMGSGPLQPPGAGFGGATAGGGAPALPLDPMRPGGGAGPSWLPAMPLSASGETPSLDPVAAIGPFKPTGPPQPLPPLSPVPEPGTWALWALGVAVAAGAARRRRLSP